MSLDFPRKEWIQNRLIDVYLLFILCILAIPLAAFHFIGHGPDPFWPAVFGFMIPEYLVMGIYGMIGLIQHGLVRWKYQDPQKTFFTAVKRVLVLFFVIYFIRLIFFPGILDCIISAVWNASPCSDVDIDGYGFGLIYLFGGTCVFIVLMMLLTPKKNQR